MVPLENPLFTRYPGGAVLAAGRNRKSWSRKPSRPDTRGRWRIRAIPRNPKADSQDDGTLKNRTRLDGGKIIIEKYDEAGKLVKVTPPGYLPFGKIA